MATGQKIEFLTDVEGNWDYFVESASASEVLEWRGPDRGLWGPGELCLRDGGIFVFGGDAPDKGPGDIRFVKTLLSLKRRYPQRCFIVLGNRDVNKLRFFAELGDAGKFQPYWNSNCTYAAYLEKNKGKIPKGTSAELSTLWWMLDDMGCATTFKTRQRELSFLMGGASDQEVLESFRNSVDPTGWDPWMLSLLIVGHVAVVIGDVLFVHAGLPKEALGHVPGRKQVFPDARQWVHALNGWKDDCLRDYITKPGWRDGGPGKGASVRLAGQPRRRGGDVLMDYGVPGGNDGRTVMYHNPFVNGNPVLPDPQVVAFLQDSGIGVVVSGHQPHGQTPTVVRHPETGLICITADTSFSDMRANKHWNAANNRGDVRNWVRITADTVNVSGVMASTGDHGCVLQRDPRKDSLPDALVGRQLQDGAWIKTVLKDPDNQDGSPGSVVAARGAGFKVAVCAMGTTRALFLLQKEFATTPELNRDFSTVSSNQLLVSPTLSLDLAVERAADADVPLWPSDRTYHFEREEFEKLSTYIFDGNGTLFDCHQEFFSREERAASSSVTPRGWASMKSQTSRTDSNSSDGFGPQISLGSRMQSGMHLKPADMSKDIARRVNEFVRAGKRVMFVTNSSNVSRQQYMHKIRGLGIELPEDGEKNVVTSSFTCAWYLRRVGIKAPFVLSSHTGLLDELRLMGITGYYATIHDDGRIKDEFTGMATGTSVQAIIQQHPDVDAIVVGWDHSINALQMTVAAAYVRWSNERAGSACARGAIPVIGCARDTRGTLGVTAGDFWAEKGWSGLSIPAVGNGVMTQAICGTVGDDITPIEVGKPSDMMLEVLRSGADEMGYGVDFSSAVVIGDTLETDVQLARRGDMKSLLVLTGTTSFEDLTQEKEPMHIPDWLLPSVAHA